MYIYQTKSDNGNDVLNVMVDGYLPPEEGTSPDVVITKYDDKVVIKVSGSAIVQGDEVQVDVPVATDTEQGFFKGEKFNTLGIRTNTEDQGLLNLCELLESCGIAYYSEQ